MAKKQKNNPSLERLFRLLICILPGVLFFSYWPVFHFGSSETMNFEISLPIIWLVVFDLLVMVMGWRKKEFWQGILQRWMWLLLPVWLSLTVLWSLNPLRGILTVGILWLIYLAVYGMWFHRGLLKCVRFRDVFWKVFWGATLVVCMWCVVQCVLDIAGVSREYSLMCAGCVYEMFGFSHPNGFAIEPQFMGNLLLAPAIVAIWFIMKPQSIKKLKLERSRGVAVKQHNGKNLKLEHSRSDNFHNGSGGPAPELPVPCSVRDRCENHSGSCFLCSRFLPLCSFIVTFTLFLTFSRGAIYAFLIGVAVMTVWQGVMVWREKRAADIKKNVFMNRRVGRVAVVWGIIVGAFVVALGAQGLMAELSPTNDTFQSGVTKVVNHLSLGKIGTRSSENAVREKPVENFVDKSVENSVVNFENNKFEQNETEGSEKKAVFDGYVAESTDTRLRLTGAAVEVWKQDFATILFGVGLGGAGQALYNNDFSPASKEIIQNQYASLLLEAGLVGVILAIFTLFLIIRVVWRNEGRVILVCLVVAYGVSLIFFSGLPNALHIYLLPALIACFLGVRHESTKY